MHESVLHARAFDMHGGCIWSRSLKSNGQHNKCSHPQTSTGGTGGTGGTVPVARPVPGPVSTRGKSWTISGLRFAEERAQKDLATGQRRTAAVGQAMRSSSFIYAYLHGFLSGPASSKGRALQRVLHTSGVELQLLDLNGPTGDPAALTHEGALAAIDACWQSAQSQQLRLIGSSFGGWAAAAYAEQHPERVDRLLLLSPALAWQEAQWERIVGGTAAMRDWREVGARSFVMPSDGRAVSIPWRFAHETLARPPIRSVRCPTCIVHGLHDAEVPPAVSRAFFAAHAHSARLVLPSDDHAVMAPATLARIAALATVTLELPPSTATSADTSDTSDTSDTRAGTSAETSDAPQSDDSPGTWEAERKVRLRDACEAEAVEAALAAAGAAFCEEERFVDSYWDWPDAALAKRGAWLRRRAGLWELKLAHDDASDDEPSAQAGGGTGAADAGADSGLSEVHEELEGAAAVIRWLQRSALLPALTMPAAATQAMAAGHATANGADRVDGEGLDALLRAQGLAPYATFGTTRRRFTWAGLSIDLDEAWRCPRDGATMFEGEDGEQTPLDGVGTPTICPPMSQDTGRANVDDQGAGGGEAWGEGESPCPPSFHRVLEVEALGTSREQASTMLHAKLAELLGLVGRASEGAEPPPEGKLEVFVKRFRRGGEHCRLFEAYRSK